MNRFITNSIWILTAVLIFGQRIAISIANTQIGIGLIVFYFFIILWVFNGQILIHKKRLLYFLLIMIGLLISGWFALNYSHYFSARSFSLLFALYFLSIFIFRGNFQRTALNAFQTMVWIVAIIGVLQFASQLLGLPYRDWLYFIPKENIIANYNYDILLAANSHFFKSNGIFLQEPSTFSQLVALSVLVELYLFKRYARLPLLIAALLVSFSGTGLILLAAGIIPLLLRLKMGAVTAFAIVGAMAAGIFLYSGFASYTIARVAEFKNPRASGYIRFIAPYVTYVDFLQSRENVAHKLFGLGPGSSERYTWNTPTSFNPPMKLLVEYGIFGFFFFFFLIYIFFARQPFWLAFSVFVLYVFLAGNLLIYQTTILFFLLLTLHQNAETT